MQYVLTEAEYQALLAQGREQLRCDVKKLQDFCTKVANEMPVKYWGNEEARTWGCILNPRGITNPGYCDECPSRDLCPHDSKRWSQ